MDNPHRELVTLLKGSVYFFGELYTRELFDNTLCVKNT